MLRAFRHVVHAAGYSWDGFRHLFRSEIAARLEIVAGVLATVWLLILGRSIAAFVILAILFCIVIAVEALNTAVEVLVDHLSPEHAEFAKAAKDLGSAAVFAMLAAAGIFVLAVTADTLGLIAL